MKKSTSLPILTPYLAVHDAAKAIAFYKKVFGAKETFRLPHPKQKIICHAQLEINGAPFMLADEFPGHSRSAKSLGGTPVRLALTVDDVDTVIKRAKKAGATVTMEPADQFYGQRSGCIRDPFGHEWMLQHEVEKVEHAEMKRRFKEMVKQS